MAASGGRSPLLLLLLSLGACVCYRLDRPRLLLPYSPTTSVRAELHVSDPEGGCFEWQSSRSQDIEVVPMGAPAGRDCSDRAEIRTTAKVAGNVSAMVHAVDPKSRTRLSCEVRVDYISSIEILTTTSVIFIDAVPVKMQIQARNSRGAAFSTLGALPFEWSLTEDDNVGDRPIRIVPFTESEWEGASEVVELEREGKRGHSVLVEGITTGWSTLTARLAAPAFKSVAAHSLEVVVVANLQLLPSYTLYVPVHTVIPFHVEIIRQQTAHAVAMPSKQYLLKVEKGDVCSLDVATSSVTALKRGTTEVLLLSHNVDAKLEGVSPPSTSIHVTDPRKIKWTVSGGNWLLQVGQSYKLQLTLLDARDNIMFISDEARFETEIPSELFSVTRQATNGTYFEVVAKRAGTALLKSRFAAIVVNGRSVEIIDRVRGEQTVDVVEALEIVPPTLVLPLAGHGRRSEWTMKAVGGSGAVEWRVEDESIVSIGSATGVVASSSRLGETTITAVDIRNRAHSATATARVVEVQDVSMGKGRVEAVEGGVLWLNVQVYGVSEKGERLAITDCTSIDLSVRVEDENVLTVNEKSKRRLPQEGSGCVSIALSALRSGDTKVTVELAGSKLSAYQHLSVYPPLVVSGERILLGVGSAYRLEVKGGPRPWIIDPSAAYQRSSVADSRASSSFHDSHVEIKCGAAGGTTEVSVEIGNGATTTNTLPARERAVLRVCCVKPSRVVVLSERGAASSSSATIDACPAHTKSLFVSSSMRLSLAGYGRCEGEGEEHLLASVSALSVQWKADNDKLAKIEPVQGQNQEVTVRPKGTPGSLKITADCGAGLKGSIELRIFDKATISQSSLVLWNDASVKGEVRVEGGSGHFSIKPATVDAPFYHSFVNGVIKISPRSVGSAVLRVLDQCIDESVIELRVKVTDIQQIGIEAPEYVEVGRRVEVRLQAVDESGEAFSRDVAQLMQLQLLASSDDVTIEQLSSNRYSMTALRVGTVSLSATGRSSRSSSETLTSTPHTVQIFSPLLLFPKVVTLLSESTFQLEVVGGPKPTPAISFSLNDTAIAALSSNALIRSSTAFGYTSVTGSIQFGDAMLSQDSVVVRVVKLAGVRIVVSSAQVEKGQRILARVEGLDEGETPFAFGGADHQLNIRWSLNNTDVFNVISPFGSSHSEPHSNRYSIWLDAAQTGVASLSVTVAPHPNAHHHFKSGKLHSFQVELKSVLPLSLATPAIETGAILLTPGGSVQLSSNWPSAQIKYRLRKEDAALLSLSPSGALSSKGAQGVGVVEILREGRAILATVEVVQPATIDVRVEPELVGAQDSYLSTLPLGSTLRLSVVYRDAHGRPIHGQAANGHALLFRPHRFDLTTIEGRSSNRTLTVRLMREGETVLKIWDPTTPSLATFVRLSCKDVIAPSASVVVSTDIVCLRNPLKETEMAWKSGDSKVLRALLPQSGIFVAAAPGTSNVQLTDAAASQHLHTTISVVAPSAIAFAASSPSWISNTAAAAFRFPLLIGTNDSLREVQERKKYSAIDCVDSSGLSALSSSLSAPFDCSISFADSAQLGSAAALFHAKSYVDLELGEYGCAISLQSSSVSPTAAAASALLELASPAHLLVAASWVVEGRGHLETRSAPLPFHPAFSVLEEELALNNYDRESAIMTIRVARHLAADVLVTSCGDSVHVAELSSIPADQSKTTHKKGTVKWIQLTLNDRSSSLGQQQQPCEISVESAKTGQSVRVPVKITLVGETARRAYRELESKGFLDFCMVFFARFSHLIPNLIGACLVLIIAVLAWRRLVASRVTHGQATRHNYSAFLSDPPSHNTSHASNSLGASFGWTRDDMSSSLHSPQFHSTPRDLLRSPQSGGAGGGGTIFSNGEAADQYTRRKAGRF